MQDKAKRKFGKEEPHPSNVLRLVKALLLLPKGDLKLEDSQLTGAVKVDWVVEVENRLLVTGEYKEKTRTGKEKLEFGTTKQALWQLVEKTDTPLELPQRQREDSSRTEQEQQDDVVRNALDYLDYLGVLKDERPQNKRNTRYWKFTLTLKHKDASPEENLGVVKQKLGLETSPLEEDTGTLPLSFWQDCCRKMLPTALSINPLLHGDGVVLTIEDILPLELVERKQRPQQKNDFSPEHFQVQAPIEYETPVEHKKFLAQVLETGDSLKNRDRKIAVIGEPGAGKTTLLQEIAKEVEGAGGLPIFVRLADLGEKTLKDYLLEDWLEEATGKRRIPEDIQEDFVQQFNLGRAWLLLDGVDEIAATGNLLSSIEKQLKGWVADARMVLTCRINVWDVGKNDLYAFEKYRIQQLSYPDMVDKFIRRFFFKAGEPTKGEKLIEKLERSQPRIRDLVKNPLRLTLLCRTWKKRQGELPQTKAELYKGFVETFYEWNDKPEIDQDKRPLLNQALGELAKNAIDKEATKFRLRESFVRQELDKFDKSLFDLACRVSWLNNVGVAAENPDEPVYAFFHPTFQEYFAALAIADWDFFLPRAHDNRNPKPVSQRYRIFEPQWKEVILLWLGRPEEEVSDKQKEEFIQALVEFEDGCGKFSGYQAYFLAAAGIAEFRDCNHNIANEIVEQIVKWSFGSFNSNKKWMTYIAPIQVGARAVLLETEPIKAIDALVDLIQKYHNISIIEEAINSLGEIGKGNPKAIKALESVIQKEPQPPESIRMLTARNLGKIDRDNPKVITELVQLTQNYQNEYIPEAAINSLGEIGKGNRKYITALEQLILASQPKFIRIQAALSLGKLDEDKSKTVNILVELIDNYPDRATLIKAIESLGEIGRCNQKAISTLKLLIQKEQPQFVRIQAALNLGKIDKDKSKAVDTLVEIIQNPEYELTPWEAIKNLAQIGKGIQKAVDTLVKFTDKSHDLCTRWQAARSLGKLDRQEALDALVELIDDCQNPSIKRDVAEFLGEIDKGNSKAIAALVQLIKMYQHESIGWMAAESLAKIDRGHPTAIEALINLIHNPNPRDFSTPMQALDSLKGTLREDQQMKKVVLDLKDYLSQENRENDIGRYCDCYELIWHCSQNMTYPDFYQAWHQQETVDNTTTPNSQSLNQADLPQRLQSAIANDPQLSKIIHLICIDGSQFIEPDRPAAEIYDQMLDQNCPECNPVPETMPALKLYWNSLKRQSDKRPVLVFYASSTNPYTEAFLTDLSKFGGAICVVTSPPAPLLQGEGSKMPSEESKSSSGSPSSLQGEGVRGWGSPQLFAPSQAIANLLEWIREKVIHKRSSQPSALP